MRSILTAVFICSSLVFLVACDEAAEKKDEPPKSLDQLFEDAVRLSAEPPPFSIVNTTSLEIKHLLEADGARFYSPDSSLYYGIGENPILFIEEDNPYLAIPNWNLKIMDDTVIFTKAKELNRKGIGPVAYINKMYHKYDVGLSDSCGLGKISLSANGFACDDSYSGQFDLQTKQGHITIAGLGNLDVFESKNGKELYLLSYHNCLAPDLKIYRIRK